MNHPNRLEELVNKYENTLFRTALAILGDRAGAEDAVQDTFLRYLEKRPEFADGNHEKAWLLRVTANACKSRLRTLKLHPVAELLEDYPAETAEESGVLEAVLALEGKYRLPVYLYYYEGYSVQEAAAILGLNPSTVQTRLQRAREKLKKALTEEGEGDKCSI